MLQAQRQEKWYCFLLLSHLFLAVVLDEHSCWTTGCPGVFVTHKSSSKKKAVFTDQYTNLFFPISLPLCK